MDLPHTSTSFKKRVVALSKEHCIMWCCILDGKGHRGKKTAAVDKKKKKRTEAVN